MSDVARLAGVSVKTVSRVVNAEAGVQPATAERVSEAIARLGFSRNLGARDLRRGVGTGMVGLVVEDVGNPFYSLLTRAVEEVARARGRRVLTGSSDEDPAGERELVREFCARRVDGLLVVPAGREHGYLRAEIDAGTPVVFVDRPAGDLDADTVLLDDAGGTEQAVHHLVGRGHRRIGFLGDDPAIHTAAERLRGYRSGLHRAGIAADPVLTAMGPHTAESVRAALTGPLRPATAVITGNNRITVHLLRVLAGAQRRPALVGFDDFELADLVDPPVTVITHDTRELGRTAAELLFSRLDGDTAPARHLVIPTRLLPRRSGEVSP
ncbi:LacI family DNA-binding transcriptional regulator [Saccharopolyspora cebuensis]|uniref:LacI family DNA-binding transcriptional regulator n=1 Tax=Saccharopolyspora cebuensis TaxID=418759 RepID=A0ABV4CCB9_9PSEU